MVVGFLAGDGEDAGADDGAEAEPDEVPPGEASFHIVFALFGEVDEFGGVGGAAEEAVFEAVESVGEGGGVGGQVLEAGLGEEVPFAKSPVGFWWWRCHWGRGGFGIGVQRAE